MPACPARCLKWSPNVKMPAPSGTTIGAVSSALVRRTENFTRNYQGVNHAKWLQNHHDYANPDRQRHLLPARSGGHRAPPVPSRSVLKTRERPTSGIWRLPALKPKLAILSGQRTIASTPNIISDRCPRKNVRAFANCGQGELSMIRACMWPLGTFGRGQGTDVRNNMVAFSLARYRFRRS